MGRPILGLGLLERQKQTEPAGLPPKTAEREVVELRDEGGRGENVPTLQLGRLSVPPQTGQECYLPQLHMSGLRV